MHHDDCRGVVAQRGFEYLADAHRGRSRSSRFRRFRCAAVTSIIGGKRGIATDTFDKEVADLVRDLPPEAQAQVRDFVEFLLAKHRRGEQASALVVLLKTAVEHSIAQMR